MRKGGARAGAKEEGGDTLDNYEAEVVGGAKKLNRELHRLFATLQVTLAIPCLSFVELRFSGP